MRLSDSIRDCRFFELLTANSCVILLPLPKAGQFSASARLLFFATDKESMPQFNFRMPWRVWSRAGALAAFCVLSCAIGFAQAAQPAPSQEAPARVTETQIDGTVKDDPAVDKMLGAYRPKVRELSTVIGTLKGELHRSGVGAGSLGNFVTDGLLAEARKKLGKSVVLAVTNGAGLRKTTMSEGDIHMSDIWELLPFENALVRFDLTGEQLLNLLNQSLTHRDAQSGARIVYRLDADKKAQMVSARLLVNGHEEDIDPQASYTVVSIDYLLKRQSTAPSDVDGNYSVLAKAQKIEPLGITIRDAIIQYVKDETAAGRSIQTNLDGRFRQEDGGGTQP